MSKKIRLTWMSEGNTVVEECQLLEEGVDKFAAFMEEEDGPGRLELDDYISKALFASGRVLFEDEHGVFALFPEEVVRIDMLE